MRAKSARRWKNSRPAAGLAEASVLFRHGQPGPSIHLLNGCRLVAVPSRAETFGLAALQALAAGKPVLAMRVGGMAQFLAEVCDRLRDTCSPPVTLAVPTVESLAEGLRERLATGERKRAVLKSGPWSFAITRGRSGARRYLQVFEGS